MGRQSGNVSRSPKRGYREQEQDHDPARSTGYWSTDRVRDNARPPWGRPSEEGTLPRAPVWCHPSSLPPPSSPECSRPRPALPRPCSASSSRTAGCMHPEIVFTARSHSNSSLQTHLSCQLLADACRRAHMRTTPLFSTPGTISTVVPSTQGAVSLTIWCEP